MIRAELLAGITWHTLLHWMWLAADYPAGTILAVILMVATAMGARVAISALAHAARWMAATPARRTEKHARHLLGMTRTHPESITAVLPDADESYLAELATELWPHDEFTGIITEGEPQ